MRVGTAELIVCSALLCSCATSQAERELSGNTWHGTRSARGATWGISISGAGSIGYASPNERLEIGSEAWGIFTLFGFAGVGPYCRLRPIPGDFGRKVFVHAAAYGGYQTGPDEDDSQWRVLPNGFVGYMREKESDGGPQRFYGLGLEGIFIWGYKW